MRWQGGPAGEGPSVDRPTAQTDAGPIPRGDPQDLADGQAAVVVPRRLLVHVAEIGHGGEALAEEGVAGGWAGARQHELGELRE